MRWVSLLGRYFRDRWGSGPPSATVFPLHTVAGELHLIGNMLKSSSGARPSAETGGRSSGFKTVRAERSSTEGALPLGRVVSGFGNDGRSDSKLQDRQRRRHVSPRPTAAAEPVARRLAARARRAASIGGAARVRAPCGRSRRTGRGPRSPRPVRTRAAAASNLSACSTGLRPSTP